MWNKRGRILALVGIMLAGTGFPEARRAPAANPPTGGTPVASHQTVSSNIQPTTGFVPSLPSPQRALLDKYCVTCHNERLKTAGLLLDKMNVDHVGAEAKAWERVVRKLRSRAMPPAGRPRPDRAGHDAFIASLETELDRAAAAAPNPGRATVHRLNRVEYTNAIRDLLALEIDGQSLLPADDTGYGFDNIADVLSFSPGLLERYMLAAQKITRLVIGGSIRPSVETYTVPLVRVQEYRMSDDLPAGSRGGIAIRHYFPATGEYVLKIRMQRDRRGAVRGLREPNLIDVRLDGARVTTFTLGGTQTTEEDTYERSEDLSADEGLVVRFPVMAGPRVLGVTFQERRLAIEGVGPSHLPAASASYAVGLNTSVESGKIEMGVDSIDIEGPFETSALIEGPFETSALEDTPSRRQIFVCRPTDAQHEEPCAKRILSTLARRAYRRPATERDLQTLLGFYQAGRNEGSFDKGVQAAIEAILVDPEFLFRVERDPMNVAPGTSYRLTDLELASRLSFFLWSSIPDDELLDVATSGKLKDPAVLSQQVQRMLSDTRSEALIKNFFGQWLAVRNMQTVSPDPKTFPEFDDNLREAFQRESELLIDSQLREDRSALDLLTANYTFVNERLARHYGIPHVYGSHFRRVTFSDDRRAGILGHGSILTVTSYAHRTSPVVRGKWLLDTLLGAPPPPPPANVPPFPENDGDSQPTTVRERMEQHRKNPVCATCHAGLDPMGFALENFDGIGKWRSTEASRPIDPSGTFLDGSTFDSPSAFRLALQQNYREPFIATLTEKLLTYALGRGVEYYDMPAIRRIVREAASNDYKWSSLIMGIVESMPFQMRRAES